MKEIKYPAVEAAFRHLTPDLIRVDNGGVIPREEDRILVYRGNNQAYPFNPELKQEVPVGGVYWVENYQSALYYKEMFYRMKGLQRKEICLEWINSCVNLRKLSDNPEQLYYVFKVTPTFDMSFIGRVFKKWNQISRHFLKYAKELDQYARACKFSPDAKAQTEEDPEVRNLISRFLVEFKTVDNPVMIPIDNSEDIDSNQSPDKKPDIVVEQTKSDELITSVEEAKQGYKDSEPGSERSDYYRDLWIKLAKSKEELNDILGYLSGRKNPWKKMVLDKLEMIGNIDLSD